MDTHREYSYIFVDCVDRKRKYILARINLDPKLRSAMKNDLQQQLAAID